MPKKGPNMERKLLLEAAEWRLISLLLMPPEEGWDKEVSAIASEVEDLGLKDAAAAACREGETRCYHTLLGPGGLAKPRAVSHGSRMLPGEMLSELRGLYQALGYNPGVREPPDHVAVMSGFVAYLKLKEALGDPEQARMAQRASSRFVREHLEHLARCLAQDLETCGTSYLVQAAKALLVKVEGFKKGHPLWGARQKRKDHCIVDG